MVHQLGSPPLRVASQHLQGILSGKATRLPVAMHYLVQPALGVLHASCLRSQHATWGRQHDSIMSAASLPFPARLTGCEARAERLVTCRCCQLCRGQWTSDVTAWTSQPLLAAVHTAWHPGKRWLMPLSWSCSAGASTLHYWRRLRIGRCQRVCPLIWRPSALMAASHQTGGCSHINAARKKKFMRSSSVSELCRLQGAVEDCVYH